MALTQKRTTYLNPAATVKVAMDEAIAMISPDDVPLTSTLSSESIVNKKQEWLNDELAANFVTVDAASALASTTISVSTADATNIRPGDILTKRGGTVQALVTAVDFVTAGDLTVIRPYAGSTDEALAADDVLDVIGQAMVEGADPQLPKGNNPTTDFNLTQIFQEQVAASRTSRKNEQYGISDIYAYDLAKRMRELAIKREMATIHGLRNDDVANSRRSFGGLLYYATQNTTAVDATATLEADINTALQACYEQGGSPTWLVVSPAFQRKFSELNQDRVLEERTDTGVGRMKRTYVSDFGNVTVTMDRWMPKNKALVLDPSYISQLVFDNWFHEFLAKTGDSDKGQIVGEFSLKVKAPKAHATLNVTGL